MTRFRPGVLFFNQRVQAHWEVWVLDNYSVPGTDQRTHDGQLMYEAKYTGNFDAAQRLCARLAQTSVSLASQRSTFSQIEAVCAVPYFGPSRAVSVPHLLATHIASALSVPDRSDRVHKVRATPPAKGASSAMFDHSQFEVKWDAPERRILLVDDVYRTGGTLASLAEALRLKNLTAVAGTAAVRAT